MDAVGDDLFRLTVLGAPGGVLILRDERDVQLREALAELSRGLAAIARVDAALLMETLVGHVAGRLRECQKASGEGALQRGCVYGGPGQFRVMDFHVLANSSSLCKTLLSESRISELLRLIRLITVGMRGNIVIALAVTDEENSLKILALGHVLNAASLQALGRIDNDAFQRLKMTGELAVANLDNTGRDKAVRGGAHGKMG